MTLTSIGIGDKIETQQLYAVASEPKFKNIFLLESFERLKKRLIPVVLYHAGCNVENPFKETAEPLPVAPTNSPDALVDDIPLPPQPLKMREGDIGGRSDKLLPGTLILTMQKSKSKRVVHVVELEQVVPSTKELVDRIEVDGVVDFDNVEVTNLPLGFEYYARSRSYNKGKDPKVGEI